MADIVHYKQYREGGGGGQGAVQGTRTESTE